MAGLKQVNLSTIQKEDPNQTCIVITGHFIERKKDRVRILAVGKENREEAYQYCRQHALGHKVQEKSSNETVEVFVKLLRLKKALRDYNPGGSIEKVEYYVGL